MKAGTRYMTQQLISMHSLAAHGGGVMAEKEVKVVQLLKTVVRKLSVFQTVILHFLLMTTNYNI